MLYKRIILAIMLLSIPIIQAQTSPILTPVVVMFGGSHAVSYTTNKLLELNPSAIKLDYKRFSNSLIKYRIMGDLIIVGHGSPNGLYVDKKVVSWKELGSLLKDTTAPRIYIASCYSSEITRYIDIKNRFVYTFVGLVDVDEASYLISSMVYRIRGNMEKANKIIWKLMEIMIGKILYPWKYYLETLAIDPGQGGGGAYYVRGIWWVYWKDYQSGPIHVKYTHPNTYWWVDSSHWYDIDLNEDRLISGDNFEAHHIPKSTLDQYTLSAIASGLASIIIALIGFLGWIGAAIAAALSIILAIIGLALGVFIDNVVRDEAGGGWEYIKDLVVHKFLGVVTSVEFDYKIGSSMWFKLILYPGFSQAIPLWYGGKDLGLGGI